MMKNYLPISVKIFLIALIFSACNSVNNNDKIAQSKKEILKSEKEFEACAMKEGMTAAFTKYAADDAVINRNKKIIAGKKAIKEFYENEKSNKDKLTWTADFVDVSSSCDLGYTYGKYIYTAIDSTGQSQEYKGIFHTVWKKQTDGSWKFVWD